MSGRRATRTCREASSSATGKRCSCHPHITKSSWRTAISNPAATAAAAAAVAIDTPRGVYAPNNSCERLFVAAAPTRCCACLLRAPKQRPPVGSGDVRQLRDFGPCLVYAGGRYLGGGLGLGGGTVFLLLLPSKNGIDTIYTIIIAGNIYYAIYYPPNYAACSSTTAPCT